MVNLPRLGDDHVGEDPGPLRRARCQLRLARGPRQRPRTRPQTDPPWEEGGEKNVYVAGHYLSLEGTNSRMVFYNPHELRKGDEIALKAELGQVYKYRVSEKSAVGSGDSWAMGEVRDRDILTLQTCIPPDFGKRLRERDDRVWDDR